MCTLCNKIDSIFECAYAVDLKRALNGDFVIRLVVTTAGKKKANKFRICDLKRS